MNALPKVASNFLTYCKKCDQDRYHKVLAHVSATSAKIECEVCHSKKTYKLNEGSPVAKAKKVSAKRKSKEAAAAEVQNAKFKELADKLGEAKPQPYRMANVYPIDSIIEHPKFGIGFVTLSLPDKIEVVFEDLNRQLVQGRK